MPILPAFYRHVVEVMSRFRSGHRTKDFWTSQNYRKSKELSPCKNGPSMSNSRSLVAPWEDGDVNSQIPEGGYLELDDKAIGPDFGLPRTQEEMDSKDITDQICIREIDNQDLESGFIRKSLQ